MFAKTRGEKRNIFGATKYEGGIQVVKKAFHLETNAIAALVCWVEIQEAVSIMRARQSI
jgi:hypothetical protein